jgi:DHA1 family bicyclomycin/chloramphenicol resistance-like MFS transporter
MTDRTADAMADTSQQETSSTALQIAVLAALASIGTLATNILLPSLPQIAASLKVTTPAVTASITVFLIVFALGQLLVGPISDRYGRRIPVLAGFGVFVIGSIWCGLSSDLSSLLIGRAIQAAGACATSVLSRAIARDLFSGATLARALTLVMIAQAAAPGFSPLLGGGLDYFFGWRSEFVFVGAFAVLSALSYVIVLGETHNTTRIPLNPLAVGTTYLKLSVNRHFLIPAATVGLIMGGLFSIFSATPRILIEGYGFTPIALGLFFAGTVLVVFGSGMLAARLAPRFGLDRSIRYGLLIAFIGSVAVLATAYFHGNVVTFIAATCVFLMGMGVVNPLGTAQALSPFGTHAGAASALLGFWQMMGAAIGVSLSATIVPQAALALGIVLGAACLIAIVLYAMRQPTVAVS